MGCDEVNKDVLDLGKEMQPFFGFATMMRM